MFLVGLDSSLFLWPQGQGQLCGHENERRARSEYCVWPKDKEMRRIEMSSPRPAKTPDEVLRKKGAPGRDKGGACLLAASPGQAVASMIPGCYLWDLSLSRRMT